MLLLDTNALISAALTPLGPSAKLIDLARQGKVSLVMSARLCQELETRLEREKFRRWLTLEDAQEFVDALILLADWFPDRPLAEVPLVCDDPDDNFLVALFQEPEATLLVSGDKAVLRISYPDVDVRLPADALKALRSSHKWGEGFLEGSVERSIAQADAEGNRGILSCYTTFAAAVCEPDVHDLLPHLVVPETLAEFFKGLSWIKAQIEGRGMATRPIYASPEVAYIKLPPDPGVNLRAIADVQLPEDTIFATMQRCPDLKDHPRTGFDNWRVFGIGAPVKAEHIPPRPLQ